MTESSEKLSRGELLKQARQARHLSLRDVHEATKIPMDALKAMEEGYQVRTISPFYYKSFLKKYAQLLGVDLSEAKDEAPAKDPLGTTEAISNVKVQPRKEEKSVFDIIAYILNIKMLRLAVFLIMGFFAATLLFKVTTGFINFVKNSFSKESVADTQLLSDTVVSVPADDKEAVSLDDAAAVEEVAVAPDVSLTVRARSSSWFRVKADEEVVFQSTLRAGTAETWEADDSIEITGKNISELEFELNGRLIGTLGRKDRKAKRLVVTKDGLSVTK